MSLKASWLCLTLGMVAFVPLLGWYASSQHGANGWAAAGLAGGVCWVAGLLALAIVSFTRGPNAVSGVLLAMMVRLGGPMLVAIMIDSQGGPLKEAGFFQLIVLSYLATLAVETLLMVRMVPQTGKAAGAVSKSDSAAAST
jgi:hypothetical protein